MTNFIRINDVILNFDLIKKITIEAKTLQIDFFDKTKKSIKFPTQDEAIDAFKDLRLILLNEAIEIGPNIFNKAYVKTIQKKYNEIVITFKDPEEQYRICGLTKKDAVTEFKKFVNQIFVF